MTRLFRDLDAHPRATVDRGAVGAYVEALSRAGRMRQATALLARADELAVSAGVHPQPTHPPVCIFHPPLAY